MDIDSETWETVPWRIDSGGTLFLKAGTASNVQVSPWINDASQIKKIVFEGKVIGNGRLTFLFSDLANVEEIENLNNLDTSNVTDMSSMFQGMSSLKSLDLTNFDTSKVTSMEEMFRGNKMLSNLDLSNFNTSNVTNMYGMFNVCSIIDTLDLSNFNTSNVINLRMLFGGTQLEYLSLGEKTTLDNSTHDDIMLDNPPTNQVYTGNWQTIGTGTQKSPNGNWKGDSNALITLCKFYFNFYNTLLQRQP